MFNPGLTLRISLFSTPMCLCSEDNRCNQVEIIQEVRKIGNENGFGFILPKVVIDKKPLRLLWCLDMNLRRKLVYIADSCHA